MSRFLTRLAGVAAAMSLAACSSETPVAPQSKGIIAPSHRNSSLAPQDVRTIFGPRIVTRKTGAPATETFALSGFSPDAALHIVNGTPDGKNRATSGSVKLDGVEIVTQSDFKKSAGTIDRTITLRNTSTITVSLNGSPGDQITISVDGSLATSTPITPGAASTVHLLGEQVTLDVPAGATSVSSITAAPVPAPSVEAVPGTTIDMGPNGTQFASPVTLSIAFDPAALPRGTRATSLHMYWWNADHWEVLPGNTVDLLHGVVSAQTTHFTTFALLPDEVEFCQTDATSEQNLEVAISHVPSGGTVYVCDGRHTANDVEIDRPVTIAAEHAGLATIAQTDTAIGTDAIMKVINVPSGTVRIRDLRIEHKLRGLFARGTYDQIDVTNTAFIGPDVNSTSASAVRLEETTVATAKAVFDHDNFSNAYWGIEQLQPVDIDVLHSTFNAIGNFALIIYTANGSQNPPPPGFSPKLRTGRFLYNTFTYCGGVCIGIEQAGRDTVRFNTITIAAGSVIDAILMNRAGQSAALTVPNVISDNIITGHGPTGDSTISSNWGVAQALRVIQDQTTPIAGFADIFERNTIDGAFVGLDVRPPRTIAATDNRILNTYGAVSYFGATPAPLIAHRNDFINYHYAISTGLASHPINPQPVAVPAGSLTCNHWGPVGPVGVFADVPLTSYTPFSNIPIAGQPSVSCDPNAFPTTIRVCATPNGIDPTVPTIALGLSNVPSGGTVKVCDGTYPVPNLSITKPLSLVAEGSAATLDGDGNARVFGINSIAGTVTIAGFKFIGATTSQIQVLSGAASTVNIHHNEFHPRETNPWGVTPRGSASGIQTNGPIGRLDIDHNSFIGGDDGILGNGALGGVLNVTSNVFIAQVNNGTAFFFNADGTYSVDNNSFADVGGGPNGGTAMQIGRAMSVTNNTFTYSMTRPTANVIFVGVAAAGGPPTIVSNNTITGNGNGTGSRFASAFYPIQTSGIQGAGSSNVIATGNRITNAAQGIGANQNATVIATDNVITKTNSALWLIAGAPANQLVANWNDISDYMSPINALGTANLAPLNIRCNYWGSASGPIGMNAAVPVGAYTPFAGTAVAGLPRTCSP